MTVNRVSATLARTQEKPYTTLLNDSLDLIKNTDSMAIYVYLQTKAEGWKVRRTDVMNRFGIGKDKYTKALGRLKEIGLVESVMIRNEEGKILDNQLVIHYQPCNRETEKPDTGENRKSDKPEVGKCGHLEMDQSIINESSNSNVQAEPKRSSMFSDNDMKFAVQMLQKIKILNPNHKGPNLDSWANTIRLCREQDQRTLKELWQAFIWANSNDFWCKNILSPEKLRKQFDSLTLQMTPVKPESLAQQAVSKQKADVDRDWHISKSKSKLTGEAKKRGSDEISKILGNI